LLHAARFGQPAVADVIIPYNEYSGSPTMGRGNGTSTDPKNPGYGAMRIFIQKVMDYTDENGPDALPTGQKVIFQRDQNTERAVNALRAGVQFANTNATPRPVSSEPSWGFIYNSVPFGMNFEQTLEFLTMRSWTKPEETASSWRNRSWIAEEEPRSFFRSRRCGASARSSGASSAHPGLSWFCRNGKPDEGD
jgi:hypothetical protein